MGSGFDGVGVRVKQPSEMGDGWQDIQRGVAGFRWVCRWWGDRTIAPPDSLSRSDCAGKTRINGSTAAINETLHRAVRIEGLSLFYGVGQRMRHHHTATVVWTADETPFTRGKYNRAHRWIFDGGIEIEASASPLIVPLPYSREDAVDPEEAFIAAIASCHMLTFLYLASKRGLEAVSYRDCAIGYVEASPNKRLSVTRVILRPDIEFRGDAPTQATLHDLHHAAHEECFIANSVKTAITIEGF